MSVVISDEPMRVSLFSKWLVGVLISWKSLWVFLLPMSRPLHQNSEKCPNFRINIRVSVIIFSLWQSICGLWAKSVAICGKGYGVRTSRKRLVSFFCSLPADHITKNGKGVRTTSKALWVPLFAERLLSVAISWKGYGVCTSRKRLVSFFCSLPADHITKKRKGCPYITEKSCEFFCSLPADYITKNGKGVRTCVTALRCPCGVCLGALGFCLGTSTKNRSTDFAVGRWWAVCACKKAVVGVLCALQPPLDRQTLCLI